MDTREVPRIGNRSDALELLEQLINTVHSKEEIAGFIRQSLEALKDAAEREIL
jgi:uncharacterized membrane protein affecting hemolysin expression